MAEIEGGSSPRETPAPWLQFRLSTLLLSILVVATSLALVGGWGIPCAGYVLLFVACVRAAWSGNDRLASALAVLLVGIALCIPLVPVGPGSRPGAPRAQCANNVKQIALALLNYRDTHGRFPPPYLADKDGKPAHSWRVLILPSLEENALHKQYNFKEPWNGPANGRLARTKPDMYVCLSDASGRAPASTSTSYVAVIGPGTVWAENPTDSGAPSSPSNAAMKSPEGVSTPATKPSDPGTRILVVEVANSGIGWTEPRDLTLEEALAGVNPRSGPAISSEHATRGANVAFADGQVMFLPANTPRDLLKALLTEGLDDGKMAKIDQLPASQPEPNRYLELRLAAWALSILALLVHGLIVDARRRRG